MFAAIIGAILAYKIISFLVGFAIFIAVIAALSSLFRRP